MFFLCVSGSSWRTAWRSWELEPVTLLRGRWVRMSGAKVTGSSPSTAGGRRTVSVKGTSDSITPPCVINQRVNEIWSEHPAEQPESSRALVHFLGQLSVESDCKEWRWKRTWLSIWCIHSLAMPRVLSHSRVWSMKCIVWGTQCCPLVALKRHVLKYVSYCQQIPWKDRIQQCMAYPCVYQTAIVVQKQLKNTWLSHTMSLDDMFLHYNDHGNCSLLWVKHNSLCWGWKYSVWHRMRLKIAPKKCTFTHFWVTLAENWIMSGFNGRETQFGKPNRAFSLLKSQIFPSGVGGEQKQS